MFIVVYVFKTFQLIAPQVANNACISKYFLYGIGLNHGLLFFNLDIINTTLRAVVIATHCIGHSNNSKTITLPVAFDHLVKNV